MVDKMDEAIDKIQDLMIKKKGKLFIDFIKDYDAKTIIKPVNIDEEEKKEESALKISTGTIIDEILGGGIPEGKSALLYGEFGSGKTQTTFTLTALCQNGVVYIDPEDSFSFKRLKEICEARQIDYESVKKRLFLYKPTNWVEQMLIPHSIGSPVDYPMKIDLIICDSLSKFFRGVEFQGRQTLPLKTGFLREFILALETIAKMHKAALIYTSQITEQPAMTAYTSKADTQRPIGGHSVEHQPDFILFFRKSTGNIRIVRMVDSSWNSLAERAFVINKKGIDDLPEEAKATKNIEKASEKFEAKQKQEENITEKTESEEEVNEEE